MTKIIIFASIFTKRVLKLNTRVKQIRKLLKLSQEEFASRLGITAAGISRIESGKRKLTEQMLIHICKEFNVNEDWLRYGRGEIFKQFPNAVMKELMQQYQLDELDMKIISEYILLDDNKRRVIKDYIMKIAYYDRFEYLSDGELTSQLLHCAEGQDGEDVQEIPKK